VSFGLNIGSTKAAATILAIEDGINFDLDSEKDKWTKYLTKDEMQYHAAMHLNSLNDVIYKDINRIQVIVADMRPLNYWFCCRLAIVRDITS